jgi:hypothetical protein
MTNAVNLASAAGTGFFRNKLINGGFDVWQRGTSFGATTPVFTADRWFVTHAGSALTTSYVRQDAVGVWGQAKYYIRLARTAGSGMTLHSFTQRIEGVETLSGTKATFSFDCRDLNGARTVGVRLVQNFGSGGSSEVSIASQSVSIPSADIPQRRSVTFDIPSIAGKTIGASNYLALIIDLPLGENFQIDLSNAQLEEGSVATPFERRHIGFETQLCQRFYRRYISSGNQYTAVGSGVTGSASQLFRFGFPLSPQMRSSPSASFVNAICWNGNIGGGVTSFTNNSSIDNFDCDLNTSGLIATIGLAGKLLLLSNGYLELSAEL